MGNKSTIKALEDLVKTEYMAIGALDAAIDEVDDKKVRKQYSKFRDSHEKQAEALNERIEDLGGDPVPYEVGTGKGQAGLWGKITGMHDDTSIAGMRIGAERGIKRYIDNIDNIDDPKALNIVRKNLEAKQNEMQWYDEQSTRQSIDKAEQKLESTKDKVEMQADGKKKGGLPFPLLILVGAAGAAAYFLLRRNNDDFDDYDEDAFQYEGEEATGADYASTGATDTGSTS